MDKFIQLAIDSTSVDTGGTRYDTVKEEGYVVLSKKDLRKMLKSIKGRGEIRCGCFSLRVVITTEGLERRVQASVIHNEE